LLKDSIEPMPLTRYKVAEGTGVPQRRIDEICPGQRAMTANTSLRLGRVFGMDPQIWLNLQSQQDLEVAEREWRKRLAAEVTPLLDAASPVRFESNARRPRLPQPSAVAADSPSR